MNVKIVSILLLAMLSLTGCSRFKKTIDPSPSVGSYHHPAPKSIQRVAVLPMESHREDRKAAELLQQSIIKSLRARGAFEIIEVPATQMGFFQSGVVRNGRYDERQLVALHKQLNVDAVMFSSLNHARLFTPQSWSAICHIVDVRESTIIATAEGVWDMSNSPDVIRFQKFVETHNLDLENPELASELPRAVAEFAALEISLELY